MPALNNALRVAGGWHSSFVRTDAVGPTTVESMGWPTLSNEAGITSIVVPEVSSRDPDLLARYRQGLADDIAAAGARTRCGWIVDLRGNRGGNYQPMLTGLTPLLSDGVVAEFHWRDEVSALEVQGGSIKLGGEQISAVSGVVKNTLAVAVLQDGKTISSGEVVLGAFDGQRNARSFGVASAGYPTLNRLIPLGPEFHYNLNLTTGVLANRHGHVHGFEVAGQVFGAAIHPAQFTSTPEQDSREWLRTEC